MPSMWPPSRILTTAVACYSLAALSAIAVAVWILVEIAMTLAEPVPPLMAVFLMPAIAAIAALAHLVPGCLQLVDAIGLMRLRQPLRFASICIATQVAGTFFLFGLSAGSVNPVLALYAAIPLISTVGAVLANAATRRDPSSGPVKDASPGTRSAAG